MVAGVLVMECNIIRVMAVPALLSLDGDIRKILWQGYINPAIFAPLKTVSIAYNNLNNQKLYIKNNNDLEVLL